MRMEIEKIWKYLLYVYILPKLFFTYPFMTTKSNEKAESAATSAMDVGGV